tara:strand:+ start:131 stop:1639 length:1509 start_codon:yes stop_codon:yes gene_type:complete
MKTHAPKAGDITLSENIFLTSYISETGSNEPFRMDISGLVQEIQLFEGINYSTLAGAMVLVDASGLLDRLPLTGNELLEFTAHTPGFTPDETKYPRGYDFTMQSGFPMFVYKVRNISEPSPGVKTYILEFCSKENIKDKQRKICRAFEGPIHKSVIKILRAYLKSQKNLFYESTAPVVKYVIPKKTPMDTIRFLGKESISKKFKSAGFFFYETSDGFHFKSLESMISNSSGVAKQPIAEYSNSPKVESGKMYREKQGNSVIKGNMEKVFEFNILNRYDTLSSILKGVYASRIVTYDPFTKQHKELDFSYPHEFVNTTHMGQLSKDKTSEANSLMPMYNYEDNKLLSDFPEGKYMFVSSAIGMHDKKNETTGQITAIDTAAVENTLQKSISQIGAFNSFVIEIVVPGNTSVTAGDVISFETLTQSDTKNNKIDPYMSGNYLVSEVRHLIQRPKSTPNHNMTLVCIKDSVSQPYLKNDKEVLNREKGKGLDVEQFSIDKSGILV